jgi:hypothetical protein
LLTSFSKLFYNPYLFEKRFSHENTKFEVSVDSSLRNALELLWKQLFRQQHFDSNRDPPPNRLPRFRPSLITTIIFANYDGTELQTYSLEEGTTPVFFGSNPTRPLEGDNCFVFSGWDKPIVPATADATYTATYKESTIEAESLNRLQFTYQSSSTSYSVGKNSASTSDPLYDHYPEQF